LDRLLAFFGRLTGLQVWLFFSVPLLFVAAIASLWLGEVALRALLFIVPLTGYVIFYLTPFAAALRKGDRASALKSGLIALGVPAVVAIGYLTTRQ